MGILIYMPQGELSGGLGVRPLRRAPCLTAGASKGHHGADPGKELDTDSNCHCRGEGPLFEEH